MTESVRIKKIIEALGAFHPDPKPFLNFRTPFELLIATILSAQCTDARVNKVTPALFRVANTPEKIIKLGSAKLTKYIRATGFYRAKTKSIMGASHALVDKFKGRVPQTLEKLECLPGVGRKTASCVLAQAFGVPAFPVDRHVLRVAARLGLSKAKDPTKMDLELRKKIPESSWIHAHMQLVLLGRTYCRPKPVCNECPLLAHCPEGEQRKKKGEAPFN